MSRFAGHLEAFAEFTERSVSESERNTIPTFNDFPLALLEEAKKVRKRGGRFAACEYLGFFVENQRTIDAQDFCEEVLEGGADAATWRINDCLVGIVESNHEGIVLTVNSYAERLNELEGERWFRDNLLGKPIGKFPSSSIGPGLVIRSFRYWTRLKIPKSELNVRVSVIDPRCRSVERIPDSSIDVEIRRWMATLAAWWSRDYLMAEGARATVEGIVAVYPSPVVPSADGIIALRALVREAQLGDPRWPREVGFIGPDEWYRP